MVYIAVYIATVVGLFLGGPVDGTWKIREPLRFEASGETCELRRGVAYLRQDGSGLTGSYEAELACWSPFAPELEWKPRHGRIVGRVDGDVLTAQLLAGDPFPVRLEATVRGGRLSGTFHLGDLVSGEWSAARLTAAARGR